tara:strand:+ start:104 stop:418 length:315 start_codon:yes stop_codon:yes gene_type:complete
MTLREIESSREFCLRKIKEFYENIKLPLMVIMAIIIVVYISLNAGVVATVAPALYRFLGVLLCIFFAILDVFIWLGWIVATNEGILGVLDASNPPPSSFQNFCS